MARRSPDAVSTATSVPVREPEPPFPPQKQEPPGLESRLDPAPRWRGERYRPAGKLEGQCAIVTGGDSGIGRAVAYHFALEGADVLITCLPEEASDVFGRLDILVHNAAWQNRKGIADLSEEELSCTMEVNVYAYLRLARAAVPHLRPGSSIIATGSTAQPEEIAPAYVYLASNADSSYVTGIVLPITGGPA